MSSELETITVEVFGKVYHFRCRQSEIADLQVSARKLNEFLSDAAHQRKQHNRDQLIVLAALNFANLYLQSGQKIPEDQANTQDRLKALQRIIAEKLDNSEQHGL